MWTNCDIVVEKNKSNKPWIVKERKTNRTIDIKWSTLSGLNLQTWTHFGFWGDNQQFTLYREYNLTCEDEYYCDSCELCNTIVRESIWFVPVRGQSGEILNYRYEKITKELE